MIRQKSAAVKFNRGVTLLMAIIMTTVFTSIAAAMTTFVYKQNVLSQAGKNSALALFAADSGLECLIYHDLNENIFFPEAYKPSPRDISDVKCYQGALLDTEFEYINSPNVNNCDGYFAGGGTQHRCFTNTFEVSPKLRSTLTFYTYQNGANNYVIMRSRGTNSPGSKSVERALEYRYCFTPNGGSC